MPRVQLAPQVLGNFDRFFDHQARHGIPDTTQRIVEIIESIQLLAHSPLIGRKAKGSKRELVVGRASRGYGALYRYVPELDTVFVLAIRSQREAGYKRSH